MSSHSTPIPPAVMFPSLLQNAFVYSTGLKALPPHGSQIVTAALIYLAIQTVLSPTISAYLFPTHYLKLDRRSKVLWDIGVVKMIKAPLNCALCLVVIARNMQTANEITMEDRVWGYWELGSSVQAIATGFYLFEILISIQHYDVLGLPTLLHAFASSGCSLLTFRPALSYYSCRFILLELPAFPEILDGVLRKLRKTGTSLYRINYALMMTLFVFSKLLWAPYQLGYAAIDCWAAVRVGGATGQQLPLWLAITMLGSVTAVTGIGIYWFGEALSRSLYRKEKQS